MKIVMSGKLSGIDILGLFTKMLIMNSISKFWSVMSEEDQDYLSAARYALSERQVWSKDE